MHEAVRRALVIDKIPRKELDHVITLYAEGFGLISAHAKSSRRITSKLGSHLEPLAFTTVRLVKNRHLHIADALTNNRLAPNRTNMNALRFFKEFFAEESYDAAVWEAIEKSGMTKEKTILGRDVLTALGFDPEHARCEVCNGKSPRYFSALAYFICDTCLPGHAIPERCLIVDESPSDVVK